VDVKQAVRERVWSLLERERVARFPGARGRIPNHVGAAAAAERLAELPEWREARVIKANPDMPQLRVRKRALAEEKLVYMAVPRLRDESVFVRLVRGASIKAAMGDGVPTAIEELERIDLVVCGTVAVNRDGVRAGKGGGYSDLELALLIEAGLVDAATAIVTTVHPLQLLDEELPETEHDFRVDWIVTPDEVVAIAAARRPPGPLGPSRRGEDRRDPRPRTPAQDPHKSLKPLPRVRRSLQSMEARRIAVIEDEPTIAAAVAARLRTEGFDVEVAHDGPSGIDACQRFRPDLVVLDLMLPGLDGLEVCKQIQRDRPVPVLMLTARDSEADLEVGLAVGGDDYMTKPFSPRELVARVRALLRRVDRAPRPGEQQIRLGGLVIDPSSREVQRDGAPVHLTPREFDLLFRLAQSPHVVFGRARLLIDVWGYADGTGARTVDSHVRALRRKLGADVIRTVYGIGYALSTNEL